MTKYIADAVVAIIIIAWAYLSIYNDRTGKITQWEEQHLYPIRDRIFREINRMIRAYEMAHQEAKH